MDKTAPATLTSAGLDLVTPWGDELHVPAGAVASNVPITFSNAFPVPSPAAVPSGYETITEAITLSRTNQTLAVPATVIIRYSDGEVRGGIEETVTVFRFDTGTSQWVKFPGAIRDTGANKLTFTVTSFGTYGFSANVLDILTLNPWGIAILMSMLLAGAWWLQQRRSRRIASS